MTFNKRNINNLFYIFITAHLVIWTLVPSITNNNLPLDTIETLAWGSNLEWGFDKHPPASAFFVEVFYQIFGTQDWAYYLLSQICVIISFFVVFKFAEDFFENKVFCLLSVLLLEGIYFYNFTTPEFNVNVCLMPFWALTVLYLWKGFKNNKIVDWFLVGLFAGLGFLSKYLFIYLGLAMDIFLIYMIYKKKIDFKCIVSLFPFLIVLLPHLIWLTENEYITITYGLHRTGAEDPNILNHIKHPLIFLGKQIGILIPFYFMFIFLNSNNKFKSKNSFKDDKLLFLLAINLIPIALVFLTSIIMGVKIRTMWMTPFYLFFGVLIIYIFDISSDNLKAFFRVFLVLFILSPFAYAYVSITQTDKRTDYPGKEISKIVESEWLKKYPNKKINVISGSEWHAGNLSYHLKSRPKVVIENFLSLLPNYVELSIFSGHPFKCANANNCKEKRFEINNLKFQILIYSNKIK